MHDFFFFFVTYLYLILLHQLKETDKIQRSFQLEREKKKRVIKEQIIKPLNLSTHLADSYQTFHMTSSLQIK